MRAITPAICARVIGQVAKRADVSPSVFGKKKRMSAPKRTSLERAVSGAERMIQVRDMYVINLHSLWNYLYHCGWICDFYIFRYKQNRSGHLLWNTLCSIRLVLDE